MKFKTLFLCIVPFFYFANPSENPKNNELYQSQDKYHFTITKKNYDCSTFFEIDSEDTYRGNIKKSIFRLRDCYDLSDKDGWCATGVKKIFSLGLLFDWGAEIDILGVHGEFLGSIQGEVLTTAKARFSIYDRNKNLVGIAFIDKDGKGVTINPPNNETYTLARFTRHFIQDVEDDWSIIVYEPKNLDDRIIRIFAAFCVDRQDSFHVDN